MQYSFLGFSLSKMMDLNLDMKEGGTFSFFALGSKYIELTTVNKASSKDLNKEDKKSNKVEYKNKLGRNILSMTNENNDEYIILEEKEEENINPVICNEQDVLETSNSMFNHDYGVLEKEERVFSENAKGCVSKRRTKTLLLNNSSTKETNIKKDIKKEIEEIIEYLNSKINTKYKASSHNTIKLITARLREGFSIDDFKTVIDKKFKAWFGTEFEQYLTPFTLFGGIISYVWVLNKDIDYIIAKSISDSFYNLPLL